MQATFFKRIIYGIFYLAILTGVGYLVFLGVRPAGSCFDGRQNQDEAGIDCGGACVSCAIKALKSIEVVSPTIVAAGADAVSVLLEFRNPNITHAARSFTYTLTLFDSSGGAVQIIPRESFMHAGEVKFQTEIGIPLTLGEAVRAEAIVSSANWVPRDAFPKPQFTTRDIQIDIDATAGFAALSGLAVNGESRSFAEVTIHAVVSGTAGAPDTISKTSIQNIQPFAERAFRIVLPYDGAAFTQNNVLFFIEASR